MSGPVTGPTGSPIVHPAAHDATERADTRGEDRAATTRPADAPRHDREDVRLSSTTRRRDVAQAGGRGESVDAMLALAQRTVRGMTADPSLARKVHAETITLGGPALLA